MTSNESRTEIKPNVIPSKLVKMAGSDQLQKTINQMDSELAAKRDSNLRRIPLEKLVQVAELLK